MNRKIIVVAISLVVTSLCVMSCTESLSKKKVSGPKYYSQLQKALFKEYGFSAFSTDTAVVCVLHSDTLCSCNGKNLFLVNYILSQRPNVKPYILLKNDWRNVVRNQLYLKNAKIYVDTSNLMEANGVMFEYDKIFSVIKGNYDNMFDLIEKDFKPIKKYYSVAN